jgi:UDP-glucose 4-epimerase
MRKEFLLVIFLCCCISTTLFLFIPHTLEKSSSANPHQFTNKMANILVTGGAGYIGSHTVIELVNAGYSVTIVDNLINSSPKSIDRVRTLVKTPEAIDFVQLDVLDAKALEKVLDSRKFDGVIHFAALKAVGESVSKPLAYYENNLGGLLSILEACRKYNIRNILFSSSATVYGNGNPPFTEQSPIGTGITNPYGQTKFMAEQILRDFQKANPSFSVALLRYFNPVGAHESGIIGEDPAGIPNNLMPYIQRVAVRKLPKLTVHGNDWETVDGTGVRDYIHVVDLAKGHVAAMAWLQKVPADSPGVCDVFNLGTGTPTSVIQLVRAFERASGVEIPFEYGPRRPGDVAGAWANPEKANAILGWKAQFDIDRMCTDSWRWVSKYPNGYKD